MVEDKKKLFLEVFEDYRTRVEKLLAGGVLDRIFEEVKGLDFMKRYSGAFSDYTEGGKRLRAFGVIFGYNMSGNETDEDIVLSSLAYELFQSGVLIHDDIIDESDLRRNKPAMHIVLGNGKEGVSKAICVGDDGIIAASDAVLLSGFDSKRKTDAIANLNKTFRLTIAGEIRDIELSEETDYTLDDIIGMYELKTSRYSFTGPMQLGLILGGADEKMIEDAERLGSLIGTAFQIKDDILGIYGATDTTGKSNVSDIEEGKKTVLTSFFRDNATPEQKKAFSECYGLGKCDEAMAETVRNLLDESGAHSFAEDLCREYTEKAVKVAGELEIGEEKKDVLLGLIEYLNDRDR